MMKSNNVAWQVIGSNLITSYMRALKSLDHRNPHLSQQDSQESKCKVQMDIIYNSIQLRR